VKTGNTSQGGVGKPISRLDGKAKVTGDARYAAEAAVPNAAFGFSLQSWIAKGTITSLDTAEAERAAGVIAILTPKNMPKLRGGYSGDTRAPLSDMKVVYAGQHIAVVVADTPERARDAASLIKVIFAEDKPIVDLHDSRVTEEPVKSFFGGSPQVKEGDVNAASLKPGVISIQETYFTPVETHNPMEMSATVALWEGDDKLTVWDSTQGVTSTHQALAHAFGLKPENVRVYCPFTGGGFGCKGEQWPNKFLAVAAAKLAKRPVRLPLTRAQMFTCSGHRPLCEQEMKLAATPDGKLVGIRHATVMQSTPTGTHVETCGMGTSRLLYATANLDISHNKRTVDLSPATWMRAPGETPGMFALESAMDELAHKLGIDPIQLRLINHNETSPENNLPWSSKHLKECYARGAEKFGWHKRTAQPGSLRTADGRPMGYGMASATYPAFQFPGSARIRLYASAQGGVRAVGAAASQDLGTGTWTIGAQMTATLTGLDLSSVKFELGDSSLPPSAQSGGSTTAASIAQALGDASEALKGALLDLCQGTPLSGHKSGDVELKNGLLVSSSTPAHFVPIRDLISKSGKAYVEGLSSQKYKMQPKGEDYAANERKYAFQSFGAHFVEVQIDDPVPLVRVTWVVSVMDVGKILNPKTARSQVLGGVVMGLGQVLTEEARYDPNTGRPVNDNFADYAVPVNPDVHDLQVEFVEVPDYRFNVLGCRGVGEIGITGVAAAVANAVFHATGKRIRSLPITPDKLL
jgi:xanthine dehydrogenase YagR molybdenum-binding subunit